MGVGGCGHVCLLVGVVTSYRLFTIYGLFILCFVFSHVTEVLVNSPGDLAATFLLPSDALIVPHLSTLYPHVYNASTQSSDIVEGGVASGVGVVYSLCVDRVFEGHNMAAIVTLLNYLHVKLVSCYRTMSVFIIGIIMCT